MKFIDSHCHIHFKDFNDELVNQILLSPKLSKVLTVSTEFSSYTEMHKLLEHEKVFGSVGIHPCSVDFTCENFMQSSLNNELKKSILQDITSESFMQERHILVYNFLENVYKEHKKIIAIGETGLDKFKNTADIELQKKIFQSHIDFASKHNIPLIVHTRDAEQETLDILQGIKSPVILHCFTGSKSMAKEAIKRGWYISFSGILTFKNANELREIASEIPIENILIETDSPYLTPQRNRGKYPNTPLNIDCIAEELARLRSLDLHEVVKKVNENFNILFKST